MSEVCEFCDTFYCENKVNSSKKYTKCCHDAKVHLPNLTEAPDLLKELLCSNSQEAKNYRQQIREYNVALSFASMRAEIKAPPGTVYSTLQPLADNKFNAHINVEVCASVKSVKYLYKYVYEGHDAASVRLQPNNCLLNYDKFLTFLDGRYVSVPEAMWRLNEFSLSEKSHVIMRLSVHLSNQQQVVKKMQ
ncbi:hypothetical protein AVEN_94782-1 [Araneus ventricosus]|uniref:Helitron helicase-like domain-containing protein n=1 Tax=Araneus ventricosus TaxID=182803 RepID=A0A4Y2CMV2_ARAVE|nr:hypothetical protein AVEN_94782-1 [Araneus ventricosus]